ncbi:MAG: hypothetical protein WAT31_04150, partial [Candidatus Saccharimonas aalborgensis]
MSFIIVLVLYFLFIFMTAYLFRRRFGVAGVTLAAGAVLAKLWTDSLTPLVASAGVIIIRPPLESIVAIVLTLLPAILVMSRSPRAHAHHRQVIGSALFALLAVMLTYGAFANAVVLDESSKQYITQLISYEKIIITVCLVLAIVDILLSHKVNHGR